MGKLHALDQFRPSSCMNNLQEPVQVYHEVCSGQRQHNFGLLCLFWFGYARIFQRKSCSHVHDFCNSSSASKCKSSTTLIRRGESVACHCVTYGDWQHNQLQTWHTTVSFLVVWAHSLDCKQSDLAHWNESHWSFVHILLCLWHLIKTGILISKVQSYFITTAAKGTSQAENGSTVSS